MAEAATAQQNTAARGSRARRTGWVVSDRGDKTVKVKYAYTSKHPKYHKYIRRTTMLHVHDEKNEAKVGDMVEVVACRRVSKTKTWRLVKIIAGA